MKRYLLTLLIATMSLASQAQRPQQDVMQTDKGELIIQPITHGSLVLQWNERSIYIDPHGEAEQYSGLVDPDLVVITDIHGDHLNMQTLEGLNLDNALFVVPQAVADQLPAAYQARITVIGNGETNTLKGVEVQAVPMYNLPESPDSRHPKGRGNGYILRLGGKNVYISGDTEDIPEMRSLTDIDIAFVCMNLPYTMDINQAASAVLEFQPAMVYPYHYRGQGGLSDTEAFKKLVNDANPAIEVMLRDWYPQME